MKQILFLCALAAVFARGVEARTFRIMSFNIRLATPADGINEWKYRRADVVEYMKTMKPDAFGMQEVKPEQLEYLVAELPDYDYVGVARDDGKNKGEYCPVFYLKQRYEPIESGTFWLSETPEEPSFGWNSACRRICSWVLLQDKKNGRRFVCANTHLDHVSEPTNIHGSELIKERLGKVAGGLPILITGDFNSYETSKAYHNMLDSGFPMVDAHKVAKKCEGMRSSLHIWGEIPDEKAVKIDFAFITPGIKVKKSCVYDSYLGDGRWLSDHHPYYADLDGKKF